MKVIFLTGVPFSLAHGGEQVVTEKLMQYLPALGVEVEPLRWWDPSQRGEILHYIGRPPLGLVKLAQKQGMKVVLTQFLDQTSSRGRLALAARRLVIQLACSAAQILGRDTEFDRYRQVDAMVFVNAHEWGVAKYLYSAHPDRGHLIDHGLDPSALERLAQPAAQESSPYLVSIATIVARKNTVGLAEAALKAKVPVHFLGKPLTERDPYFKRFMELVDDQYVIYQGFVSEEEKHNIICGAKGFTLWSEYESGCIAVYEAAAAGLPLLLSNLPWATKHYPPSPRIEFVDIQDAERSVAALRKFFDTVERQAGQTFEVKSWRKVAEAYKRVYDQVTSG